MPAYFDTGVFTENLPAWHGLGTVLPDAAITTERIIELVPEFGADVVKVPLLGTYVSPDGDVQIIDVDDTVITYRLATDTTPAQRLGTVSPRYQVKQDRDALAFAQDIVDASGAVWKTAGLLQGRTVMWGMLEMPDDIVIADGEAVKRYLAVTNSHDTTSSLRVTNCRTRIVCANTLAAALAEGGRTYAIRHTSSMEGRIKEARSALAFSFRNDEAFTKAAQALLATPISRPAFTSFAERLLPMPEPQELAMPDGSVATRAVTERAMQSIRDKRRDLAHLYDTKDDLENIRGTAWGALQATVDWSQRYAAPRRSQDATAVRTLLTGDDIQARAVALLA